MSEFWFLCVFPLPHSSVGNVIWFLLLLGSHHTCFFVTRFSADSSLWRRLWIFHCWFQCVFYLLAQQSESVVFGVFRFCKRYGLWTVFLVLLVNVHGVWGTYGQIWIEVSSVTLGCGFTKESKRRQSLPFAALKLEHCTMPFSEILQSILIWTIRRGFSPTSWLINLRCLTLTFTCKKKDQSFLKMWAFLSLSP